MTKQQLIEMLFLGAALISVPNKEGKIIISYKGEWDHLTPEQSGDKHLRVEFLVYGKIEGSERYSISGKTVLREKSPNTFSGKLDLTFEEGMD